MLTQTFCHSFLVHVASGLRGVVRLGCHGWSFSGTDGHLYQHPVKPEPIPEENSGSTRPQSPLVSSLPAVCLLEKNPENEWIVGSLVANLFCQHPQSVQSCNVVIGHWLNFWQMAAFLFEWLIHASHTCERAHTDIHTDTHTYTAASFGA